MRGQRAIGSHPLLEDTPTPSDPYALCIFLGVVFFIEFKQRIQISVRFVPPLQGPKVGF